MSHTEDKEDFLLDLYSRVKDYETQTGRSVLPALQPVYQSAPAVWNIDLSERKTSLFLEVLKLHTVKKPVKLCGWSDEESEVRSFLQCLPYISQLRFEYDVLKNKEQRRSAVEFLLKLIVTAAECDAATGESFTKLLTSVCSYTNFPVKDDVKIDICDFLLDLYSRVKDYETQTGRSVLPALQPVYQSVPAVWNIDLSKRKTSLFLEVLKLQTVKKPVELRGWSDEESEVRRFLQCLPYISQLRFDYDVLYNKEQRRSAVEFLLKLIVSTAECDAATGESFTKLLTSVCSYTTFPVEDDDVKNGICDFLLDLYSCVKDYETQTGRSVLPALQPVYQSAPAVWNIDLSKRKTSLFLEVLKLQTVKKPVKLCGWSDEESEVRSFLQCLPYISQLRFKYDVLDNKEQRRSAVEFLLKLIVTAAECDAATGESFTKLLTSVCSYTSFPVYWNDYQCDFLLDLYSHVKDYETQTGRSVLPALQPVYQSAPAVWYIDLSDRKTSLFLEVLKLQTVKKPVELRGWSDEESEVRSFLQCLPYISQLRFKVDVLKNKEQRRSAVEFLLKLIVTAAECDAATGESFTKLLTSVCSYTTFPVDLTGLECDFLLDLYSRVKNYETQTGRSFLPALQPVYQSAPTVWIINLSERKTSLFLEVLKLHTVKKPVELRGWSDEESEVRSFLQCLPYISQLRFNYDVLYNKVKKISAVEFLLKLIVTAAECDAATGESFTKLLTSVCSYTTFPVDRTTHLCDFLLDLYSHVKDYETQTGRSVLPELQTVYQSAPAVWNIDLSERKTSLFLEVLKLHTVKKPVKLLDWSDEESEVRSFLQCLPYISQLRFNYVLDNKEQRRSAVEFLLKLIVTAAECDAATGESFTKLLTSVCSYTTFPVEEGNDYNYLKVHICDFLLDLYSRVKDYETQTGRSVLPVLQTVYQSAPAVWNIDLSKRKTSLFLEVLKLHTVKKPVELRGWSDEESEVRSFLQCLPYISQLRFLSLHNQTESYKNKKRLFLLNLSLQAAVHQRDTVKRTIEELMSHTEDEEDFLLDLYSHVKDYETQTGRSVLTALQPVYQSAPAVWNIDLSKRKTSLFLEVLKLQTVKKPVELRGWSDEESEVRSFLQCLPYISQLRFEYDVLDDEEQRRSAVEFLLKLIVTAAECDAATGESFTKLLTSVCSYTTFPVDWTHYHQCDFLLDLCSRVKDYETQTGRSVLPALQPVYQSAPAVWYIDLSERKTSIFLEVLKLQTVKKPVKLRGWSDEESEVRSFLQCLPYISHLRFEGDVLHNKEQRRSAVEFLLKLIVTAAECDAATGESFTKLLTSVCSYTTFPVDGINYQCDFLLDLYSRVKDYETQTGRSVLPALQPVYQSAPAVWYIDLSERKTSLFLEVLKLHTVKKPVKLLDWSVEESEVRSFLQCVPYISQLRFHYNKEQRRSAVAFLLKLIVTAAECDAATGESFTKLLTSVCSYTSFPVYWNDYQCDFLLDLYSHVKDYETQTGRSVLPALQPVYQSAPAVWNIDLSERKTSLFLEVLKLHTVKKPVELRGWSDEESEVRSFLQCLPYISQLRFEGDVLKNKEQRRSAVEFLLKLIVTAAECDAATGESFTKLLTSVCSYKTFPVDETNHQSDFLLDLYSHLKDYKTQTGRSVLPELQPVYQSVPAVWNIDLSERKTSLFLEVLKLQTVKKPVELRGWSDEESEVRSFLQCLPYISQLRFEYHVLYNKEQRRSAVEFLLKLIVTAAECDAATGESFTKLLTSVCSYTNFPFGDDVSIKSSQCDFLLDLYSRVKDYETQTGRSVLPALQPVYQSAPAVWNIDLSERKTSLFLEVLKLQTVKKPVELRGWSDEESEVRSFLQCLPYISQLRFFSLHNQTESYKNKKRLFLLNLSLQAAVHQRDTVKRTIEELMSHTEDEEDFLLDLYSHVKDYETQTGRSVLTALQPVYQSAPAVWNIDLSKRKTSLFLEVLKLQTVKKPVELRGWSDEESEVRSFLQCLPYISQLRFEYDVLDYEEQRRSAVEFLLKLIVTAAECDAATGESFTKLLTSVCSYTTFPVDWTHYHQCDFLLDLCSRVKDYETQTGRSVLPALQPVYQSAPAVWYIDLSERKTSVFLEVLKLQTVKKPVKLRGWSDEESEVRSFLQCLPYISHLRFEGDVLHNKEQRRSAVEFLLKLIVTAAECDAATGESFTKLLTSVCSYTTFPVDGINYQCDFLLDLYSRVKDYETQTGRSVLPALQPVYQSAPAVWYIDLSERKTSLFLEVLKLHTVKKPVKLLDWSVEESEVRSFLQCLPYISQLRFHYNKEQRRSAVAFLLKLIVTAAECDAATGESFTKLLTSVCSYTSFPVYWNDYQCDFLLDLYSHVKDYETQTGRSVLPALQPVYQSAPAVWNIDLSERKTSLFLEVLKLHTVKKPVELRGWSDEESEVRSFLQCLPYISQLRFEGDVLKNKEQRRSAVEFLLKLIVTAAECDAATGESFTKLLTSVCSYKTFPVDETNHQSDFLLDLYSHLKDYKTQTGRSVLPELQPVYQSVPAVWNIDLSERKTSLFLEVLKLQTVKKPVELRGWSDEESEVRSFLQCLPYISQLRFEYHVLYNKEQRRSAVEFLLKLIVTAAECDAATGESFTKLLTSVYDYTTFPFGDDVSIKSSQCDFLLDLYSRVKDYETQTGRSVLPALQPVYQSAPAVWNIDLSERKTSLFLEVLKLQTVKKPVKLRGWSDEESEVRSFLQCLPYISQLRFEDDDLDDKEQRRSAVEFLLKLIVTAAECDAATGESFTKLLTSVCSYTNFPVEESGYYGLKANICDFLLDLYSRVKDYETQTGRSFLPALQPVYQSAPAVWNIDLSKRKTSLFLEVLKLHTVKKPVELRGWSDEESEVRSFLQCLPYISQLSGADPYIPSLCKELQSRDQAGQVSPLLQALDFTLSLGGQLSTPSCRAVGRVLGLSASTLNLTLNPRAISLRGVRLLFTHITRLRTLSVSGAVVVKMVRTLRTVRSPAPVTVEELSLIHTSTQQPEGALSRVLSSLASLLRLWRVQCLNLTYYKMEAQSLTVLLCHQGPLTIRLCEETLQQLTVVVYEAQEEELTHCFLQKVGGNLTSCTLTWEVIHYFLQYHSVTVDFRKSDIGQQNPRELLPVLDRLQVRRLSPSCVLSIITEIYQTGSAHCVSSLLSSTENCITLNSRELDSVHCAALCFTLQHCTAVSLSLLFTSIPEGELESIVPLLKHVSHLSVDRLLLLRLLHCCSVSELQQGAAVFLLSALQHRLDFSCSSALDLTEDSHTHTLTLSTEDCRVVSVAVQRAHTHTQLTLHDCEIEEAGVEQLFTIIHTVTLQCSKAVLLQFLSLVRVGSELECVRRAVSLSRALGGEVDLSHTRLDQQACGSLALVLEHSEGLSELDLSHCQLTDHCLQLLCPQLHKAHVLDLSHNDITDVSAKRIYDTVSTNTNIHTVRLFNNRITDRRLFLSDKRFEIW
ncbi:uncharacterized protein LOC143523065 [Brachyhypopomus gauderio]|uniref:uncharacterized protein LOC143523065 n=1 Tax=Brachyhypopomus gauderio TaxID=698409 RepID=UPI0040421341